MRFEESETHSVELLFQIRRRIRPGCRGQLGRLRLLFKDLVFFLWLAPVPEKNV